MWKKDKALSIMNTLICKYIDPTWWYAYMVNDGDVNKTALWLEALLSGPNTSLSLELWSQILELIGKLSAILQCWPTFMK